MSKVQICPGSVNLQDTTTFKKRIDITKKKTEFLLIHLSSDFLRLEGFQESLTLHYLVEATKVCTFQLTNRYHCDMPIYFSTIAFNIQTLGATETVEAREAYLETVLKQNAEKWKEALIKSVAHRASLSNTCMQLGEECDLIKSDFHGMFLHTYT